MKYKLYDTLFELLNASFVLLFVYTGFSKLITLKNFRDQLIFFTEDNAVGTLLSYAIPITEFIIAILLSIHRTKLLGLLLFNSMMLMFTTYIIILLQSERKLPCTCGGVINSFTWQQHLLFNIFFLLAGVATLVYYLFRQQRSYLEQV